MAKTLTVTDKDVLRLEGLAQQLVELQPADRPKVAHTGAFIAAHLGVSPNTLQSWVRLARPMCHRSDTAGAFIDAHDRVAVLLSERVEAAVVAMIAPGQRDALAAAKFILPKLDPARYDPKLQEIEDQQEDDVFSTAGVPQEVFDALSDDERAQIAELRQAVWDAMATYETLIKQAQSRVLARELAQRQADAPAGSP